MGFSAAIRRIRLRSSGGIGGRPALHYRLGSKLSVKDGRLASELGFVGSPPRDRAFKRELQRMHVFLRVDT
jgi:hypothetical protein